MDGHLSISSDIQDSFASLPPELWDVLFQSGSGTSQSNPNQCTDTDEPPLLAVALTPRTRPDDGLHSTRRRRPRGHASLVCWAVKEAEGQKNRSAQQVQVSVSPQAARWFTPTDYALSIPCSLHPTRVFPLVSVILQAQDEPSYHYAVSHVQDLQRQLAQDQQILRQGLLLRCQTPNQEQSPLRFTCLLCEPVLQGLVSLEQTDVTILRPSAHPAAPLGPAPNVHQEYEVDEHFLERSCFSSHTHEREQLHHSEQRANGLSDWRICAAAPLRRPPEFETAAHGPGDPMMHCYASISTLAQLGLVSGDLVLISPVPWAQTSDRRLARIWSTSEAQEGQDLVQFHPVFLRNLLSSSNTAAKSATVPSIHLEKWSSGASATLDKLPVSQSISLTRIATSTSTAKRFEPLFLEALKRHLASAPRIVKNGDWIAVAIDTVQAVSESSGLSESAPPATPALAKPDRLVFFRVEASALPQVSDERTVTPLEAGKYGFVVNPQITQVLQSGIEHAWLPKEPDSGLLRYFGLDQGHREGEGSPSPAAAQELRTLLRATTNAQSSQLKLDTSVLLEGAPKSGKAALASRTAASVGMHISFVDAFDLVGDTDVKTEGMLRARFARAMDASPCVLFISHVEALARKSQSVETGQESRLIAALHDCLAEANDHWQETGWPAVLVATTSEYDKLPSGLVSCFKTRISVEAPAELRRKSILEDALVNDHLLPDADVEALAVNTAALLEGDLRALIDKARSLSIEHACKAIGGAADDVGFAGVAIGHAALTSALDAARSAYSESIGAPKIPNVTWDDVGGLADVKSDILDTVQLPLQQPELFASGLKKRSGILLYGPPGTGKTLLAKAVATSCALNFFSVKGPELLNMYIGESEANVRRIFQRARDAAPCVIFFDELDSVAPKRGNQGDAGGVMDRIVSQLLAEVDGMSDGDAGSQVFVIGATNRPDLLDPALLRPGRFDRMLYLGVSQDHDAQLRILQALTRKFQLHESTDLKQIAETCPFHFTGADFYALCSDAMLKAMTRTASAVDARIAELKLQERWQSVKLTPQYYLAEVAEPEETQVLVAQEDFEQALAELSPSVSAAEMEHYARVQQQFASSTISSKKTDKKGKGKAV